MSISTKVRLIFKILMRLMQNIIDESPETSEDIIYVLLNEEKYMDNFCPCQVVLGFISQRKKSRGVIFSDLSKDGMGSHMPVHRFWYVASRWSRTSLSKCDGALISCADSPPIEH